jgi:hypothetical protein
MTKTPRYSATINGEALALTSTYLATILDTAKTLAYATANTTVRVHDSKKGIAYVYTRGAGQYDLTSSIEKGAAK